MRAYAEILFIWKMIVICKKMLDLFTTFIATCSIEIINNTTVADAGKGTASCI